jgi:hypothetical protein
MRPEDELAACGQGVGDFEVATGVRDFCGIQCGPVVLRGANCNGRPSASN